MNRITVLGFSWVLVTTLGVLEALPVRLGGHSELLNNVSCNFTSGLCGWTGSVSGGQWAWTTESAMNIKPPEGTLDICSLMRDVSPIEPRTAVFFLFLLIYASLQKLTFNDYLTVVGVQANKQIS